MSTYDFSVDLTLLEFTHLMKEDILSNKIFSLLFVLLFLSACNGQNNSSEERAAIKEVEHKKGTFTFPYAGPTHQIAEYVRNIWQDKNGNFWFGTNGYGVAHYDGNSVSYFSLDEGFGGQQVTGITEDEYKNLWFATDKGVVKYDWSTSATGEKKFNNYTDKKYFNNQRFWSIYADTKGNIWGGAVTGIYRFVDDYWTLFELPYPEEVSGEFITKKTTWSISEDKDGNYWFSTNGFGVFRYDGQSFTQYTKEDGLTDNDVDVITEAKNGDIWIGTRFGGVSRYDGTSFINYTSRDSIGNDEVCVIYEDSKGDIWLSSEGYGVYRYDGDRFSNYGEEEGLGVRAVQTIYEDREGRLWVGGGGGLYRFIDGEFVNVTSNGPWE